MPECCFCHSGEPDDRRVKAGIHAIYLNSGGY